MPDAIITSTASTFGTISGTFAADQSTVTGTVTGPVSGTLSGSVGVPGPAGLGVPAGGTAGQYLQKIDSTDYNTDWVTLNLAAYAPLNSPAFTGDPTAPTAALGDNDTSLATTAFVQQELLSGTANAKNLEVYVRNQTGSTLAAGTIVYINGATGNRPTVTKAQANNDANSAQTMGFVKTPIAHNGFGYVIVRGEVEALDTSAVAEGTQLYLSPTTAGAYTTTKPSAPQHLVYVGIVIRSHPTQGVILVAVQNGYELNELHDVAITSPTNGQVLKYNSTTGLWYNGTDSAGVAWGAITGTLSSQTDLQTALDGKYNKSAGALNSGVDLTIDYPAGNSNVLLNGQNIIFRDNTTANIYGALSNNALIINEPGIGFMQVSVTGLTFADTTFQSTAFIPADYLSKAGNLSGLADTSASRSNLGLGTMATETASNYLTTATAASTYQTLAGMSSYLTTSAAASTYLTQSNAASTYYLQTNPAGYITSSALSPYLTSATAASTYQTLAGMSSYLTTASAASTYFTIANAANKADLASPTLTGTPTAPTAAVDTNTTQLATTAYVVGQGYLKSATASSTYAPLASPALTGTPTAPTATAGTNTTQIATTAFVQTSNPDASTTTKGHVELATNAEVITGTSTSLVSPLSQIPAIIARPELRSLVSVNSPAVSGSGAVTSTSVVYGMREMYLSSLTTGRASNNYGLPGVAAAQPNMSRADWSKIDFSKKIWMAGKSMFGGTIGATNYIGDSNTFARITLGGYATNTTGDMTLMGIGFKKQGGTSPYFTLTVHNGTTLTDVASTVQQSSGKVIDWVIYSDGTGNVTLYIDGAQAATTTAGPTGISNAGAACYREQVEATTTPTVRQVLEAVGGWLYIEG